jgi:hypothetical protein
MLVKAYLHSQTDGRIRHEMSYGTTHKIYPIFCLAVWHRHVVQHEIHLYLSTVYVCMYISMYVCR